MPPSTSSNSIAPYQDPAYGEHPTYYSSVLARKDETELAQQQDEIMMDAYDDTTETGTEEDGVDVGVSSEEQYLESNHPSG
jgi:hypothetical protein